MCNQEIRLITLFFISLLPKNEVMRRIFLYNFAVCINGTIPTGFFCRKKGSNIYGK